MNLSAIRAYVRDLTGVYSTDVISDTLLNRWVNESYRELARMHTWPWLPVTDLATNTDVPAFAEEYRPALAYRTAVRVLRFQADDTPRADAFLAEFQGIVQDMVKFYLPGQAPALSGNLAQLRRLVRDLTGVFDVSVPDVMVDMMINDAYNELAIGRDWDWLEANVEVAIPAFTAGKHSITLANGTRRVLDAYLVFDSGDVRRMVQVPTLADIETWDDNIKYDVTTAGVLTFAPEQTTDGVVRVRYLTANVSLTSGTDVPAFLGQFHKILAYRAATKLLSMTSPEDPKLAFYLAEYQSMFESMVAIYELDHDTNVIQIGGDGLNNRTYVPWFKPA